MPGSLWWLTLAALICLAVATASTTGEETDREPVVLIPGLLGSVLNYADVVSRQPLGLAWLRFFDGTPCTLHHHRIELPADVGSHCQMTMSFASSCWCATTKALPSRKL
jgi:hypothetical protein